MGETGRTLACPECRKPCLRGSKFCPHCGTLQSSLELDFLDLEGDGSLPPGTLVGSSYRLVSVLGEGGMGRVYVAEHIKLGRRVAIKKLRRELASNPGAVARFFAEARAVNRIFHENIVEITDIIEQPGGDNCIIMELLKGEDLAHRLARGRTLPLVRAFGIASQIASALAAVHAAGIIHRDLKPDNIFLIERGGNPDFVKVLDFGVAKLTGADDRGIALHTTAAGQVVGTPEYMSPEQARGEAIDFRADIYALGVILYETLTGALPFQAKSFGDLMLKHMTAPVELPSRQPGLAASVQTSRDRLLLDLLAKDPADRPASMTEVERRLRELIDAILRSESSRPGAGTKPGAEAVAKVALVRRTTPMAAVEIATPRSVSRIDVLTPSGIDLSSIARPQLPPPGSSIDPTRPADSAPIATPERLAKSSSDVHPVADSEPPDRPGQELTRSARSGTDPGRQAGGSIATGAARAASPTAPGIAPATVAAPRGRASSPGIVASSAAAPGARASTIRTQGSRAAVTCATSPTASGVITSGAGPSGATGSGGPGSETVEPDAGEPEPGEADADDDEPEAVEPGATASSAVASTAAVAEPVRPSRAPAGPPRTTALRRVTLGAAVVAVLAAVSVAFELGGPFTAASAPAAQPTEVKIRFVSAPAGAEVRFAGARELLGITPFVRSFPRSDHRATFELAKPGFANAQQDIALAGDDAIAVALTPVAAAPPAKLVEPATTPEPAAPSGPANPAAPAVRAPRAAPTPERSPGAAPAKRAAPPPERLHDRNATMDVFQRE